jgi:hypothetical protein
MGQRANHVVVKNGSWQLYYDHLSANCLDTELLWGPEKARKFIEQQEATDASGWLNEVWCEGAAVLDFDHNVLLFFGGEDILYDVLLRRAHLSLMRMNEAWQEWDIRWALEGIATVAEYVGVPKAQVLMPPGPAAEREGALGLGACYGYGVNSEFPEHNNVLFTSTMDGATTARRIRADKEALEAGPVQLEQVKAASEKRSLVWRGSMPRGGVHMDFDRGAMRFWWASPAPAIAERIATTWCGWRTEWLGDRFEEHIALPGIDVHLPVRPLRDLQLELISRIHRAVLEHEDFRQLYHLDPAPELAPIARHLGSRVESAEKLLLLDRLQCQVSTAST